MSRASTGHADRAGRTPAAGARGAGGRGGGGAAQVRVCDLLLGRPLAHKGREDLRVVRRDQVPPPREHRPAGSPARPAACRPRRLRSLARSRDLASLARSRKAMRGLADFPALRAARPPPLKPAPPRGARDRSTRSRRSASACATSTSLCRHAPSRAPLCKAVHLFVK